MGAPEGLGPIAAWLLKYTKRLRSGALASAACRSRTLPSTFTRSKSARRAARVSPAACTTTSWPSANSRRASARARSPYTTRTGRCRIHVRRSGFRASTVTSWPAAQRHSARWLPMNPVAPVTAIFTGALRVVHQVPRERIERVVAREVGIRGAPRALDRRRERPARRFVRDALQEGRLHAALAEHLDEPWPEVQHGDARGVPFALVREGVGGMVALDPVNGPREQRLEHQVGHRVGPQRRVGLQEDSLGTVQVRGREQRVLGSQAAGDFSPGSPGPDDRLQRCRHGHMRDVHRAPEAGLRGQADLVLDGRGLRLGRPGSGPARGTGRVPAGRAVGTAGEQVLLLAVHGHDPVVAELREPGPHRSLHLERGHSESPRRRSRVELEAHHAGAHLGPGPHDVLDLRGIRGETGPDAVEDADAQPADGRVGVVDAPGDGVTTGEGRVGVRHLEDAVEACPPGNAEAVFQGFLRALGAVPQMDVRVDHRAGSMALGSDAA